MSYDRKKAAEKAKRTRAKNLKNKAKAEQKYQTALKRASSAEKKLKAYKEGFKDALDMLGGKL